MDSLQLFTVFLLLVQKFSALYGLNIVDPSTSVAFVKSKLVPDVLSTPPMDPIEISFPSGVSVSLGNELTPTEVKDYPTVSYKADSDAFYTFIFVDPDNYQGPEQVYREWRHWLVGNIPGSDLSKGENLAEYISSGPADGTGLHRYTYSLFKQPGKITFNETILDNKSINGRDKFSTKEFALKYQLGDPIAGNFFLCQYDDYVPILFEQLGA